MSVQLLSNHHLFKKDPSIPALGGMVSLLFRKTLSREGERKPAGKEYTMESARSSSYRLPVDQLLTYGDGWLASPDGWPNYLELGLGPEQIPDLIRMVTDEDLNWADSDSLEVWAPIHAWRTLGQLRAEAAVEPLLTLFETLEESDWVMEELPEVFAMIGPAALPALAAYIADVSHDEEARISAIPSVEKIGTRWPEARPACVTLLMNQVERFAENEPEVNGFLIAGLVDLHATEAASLIEQAFAAGRVDPTIMGDWEVVQAKLGWHSPEAVGKLRARELPQTPFLSLAVERKGVWGSSLARSFPTASGECHPNLACTTSQSPMMVGSTRPAAKACSINEAASVAWRSTSPAMRKPLTSGSFSANRSTWFIRSVTQAGRASGQRVPIFSTLGIALMRASSSWDTSAI